MDPAGQRPRAEKTLRHAPATEDLIDYCSRPMCRKEFRRAVAPGRRQEYCSEVCRRTAERELRQARSRLAHFEDLVQKLRTDVAAFGRSDVADGDVEQSPLMASDLTAAEYAVHRAGGVLAFADPALPAVQELRALYEAIAPVFLSSRMVG